MLRLAQHKVREGAGAAYLEGALVAGKGLGRRSRSRRRQGRKISSKGGDQDSGREFLFERRERFEKRNRGEDMNLRP